VLAGSEERIVRNVSSEEFAGYRVGRITQARGMEGIEIVTEG
jgi:hypothetical protein